MHSLEYTNYKEFLENQLERGSKKLFADYLGCQPAYLSQVLRSKPHLSLEQGVLATDYFKMNASEAEYFMSALQMARAGSERLREMFERRLKAIRESHQRVDNNIGNFETIDETAKATFYSSWKYALIHVLLSIPVDHQMQFLKQKSGLSEVQVMRVLEFLRSKGLIELQGQQWRPTKKRIHVSPEDPLIDIHHKNVRVLTMQTLEKTDPTSLHFSSLMALSHKDVSEIKKIILDAIARAEVVLKPSPEETLRVFAIDFYEPGN